MDVPLMMDISSEVVFMDVFLFNTFPMALFVPVAEEFTALTEEAAEVVVEEEVPVSLIKQRLNHRGK